MNLGAMRHRVEIQERLTTQSVTGQQSLEWRPRAEVWAAVEPLSGAERVAALQSQARASTRFVIRRTEHITHDSRLVWSGRVFDVVQILDQRGIRDGVVIVADERVGEVP